MYFQVPATTDEAHFYYVDAFANFLTITRIFERFVADHAAGFAFNDWRQARDAIDAVVRQELARLHTTLDGPAGSATPAGPDA